MSSDTPNIKFEQGIDAYLKGNLTEKEAQELWAELLKQPEYIDLLETEIDLTRYYQQSQSRQTGYRQYWRWAAAAAAVFLIVIGINIFSSETLNDYTIDSIFLQDNLATSGIMRSDEPNAEYVDSLLNLGFEKAINGNVTEALSIYNEVIEKFPDTIYAAKAHLNIGILIYNKGDFARSVDSFKKVLSITAEDEFIREQAYWYMANALVNVGNIQKAEKALQSTYHLNGVHRQQALWLLDKLNKKAGQ